MRVQEKSFFKTASLIAASCKSAAVFSDVSEEVKNDMYEYGKHLGLAFQVVDDILDFTQSTEQLGKPQGQDLATGNLTAPVIYSLQEEPALRDLIETRFEVRTRSVETAPESALPARAALERALMQPQSGTGLEELKRKEPHPKAVPALSLRQTNRLGPSAERAVVSALLTKPSPLPPGPDAGRP